MTLHSRITENRSYLLRVWRGQEDAPWRISLQETQVETPKYFGDLNSLFTYLEQDLAPQDASGQPNEEGDE